MVIVYAEDNEQEKVAVMVVLSLSGIYRWGVRTGVERVVENGGQNGG